MAFTHVIYGSGYVFSEKYRNKMLFDDIMECFKLETLTLEEMCSKLNTGDLASDLVWFIPIDIKNKIIGEDYDGL